jgi:hypothetical protein
MDRSKLNLSLERFWPSLAFFVLIFGIQATRSYRDILLPVLGHEDGRDMLALYFNDGNPLGVLRFYNGYISLLPNAIAWAATRGPLPIAPHVFTFASLTIATLGLFLLSRRGHSWLVPEARDRAVVALLAALLPLGQGYLLDNLTYSQWGLLFLLFVLLSRPIPPSRAARAAYFLGVVICSLSHPLSVLAAPLCVAQLVTTRAPLDRLLLLVCAGVILGYQVLGVDHGSAFGASAASLEFAAAVFLSRVAFESIFGAHVTGALVAQGASHYVYLVGISILCFIGALLLGDPQHRRRVSLAAALTLAFVMVVVSTLTRYTGPGKRLYLLDPHVQRYFYVPKLIVVIVVLSYVVPRARGVCLKRPLVAPMVMGIGLAYLTGVNLDNTFLYRSPDAEGKRVKQFLTAVNADLNRAKTGRDYTSEHVLDRDRVWDIVLNIDQHVGRRTPRTTIPFEGYEDR